MEKFKKHMSSYFIYYTSSLIFILTTGISLWLQLSDFSKNFYSLISGSALLSILFKIWFDNLKHERDIILQNKQQDFLISTSSHMAQVAYDKHVKFCEEYISIMQNGREKMFRDGLTKNILDIGRELVLKRREHSTWITKKIEDNLKPFEDALIRIGADKSYINEAEIETEKRKIIVKEMFRSFGLVTGSDNPLNEDDANIQFDVIIEKVKNIIGVNELTTLREKSILMSIKRLQKK